MPTKVLLSLLMILLAAGAAPASPVPLPEAETRFLDAYDALEGPGPLKVPRVGPRDRRVMQWLVEAATREVPGNPFPKGTPQWREAQSICRLPALPVGAWPAAIDAQGLTLSGSQLAFWRWGQAREGRMAGELRQRWEDRLLASHPCGLVFGYALRHALCFALAQADDARFATLKDRWSADNPDLFLNFQRAFALLGSPSPAFTLWRLPELTLAELPLQALGGKRVWIAADSGKGLPELAPDTAWIVPTKEGLQPEGLITLLEPGLGEARDLAGRLQAAGRRAFLAPSRKSFQTYALMYFPILLELDAEGTIRKIRMGDAALVKP